MKLRAKSPAIQCAVPRATILFADDDADTCEMMRTLLGFDGYEVVTAMDGRQAIEVARRRFPHLILIDLELPRLDGISVVKKLKRDRRFKTVPMVMISGHGPARFEQQALEAGCEEYLLKPLDFDHIRQMLDRACPIVRNPPERRGYAAA